MQIMCFQQIHPVPSPTILPALPTATLPSHLHVFCLLKPSETAQRYQCVQGTVPSIRAGVPEQNCLSPSLNRDHLAIALQVGVELHGQFLSL